MSLKAHIIPGSAGAFKSKASGQMYDVTGRLLVLRIKKPDPTFMSIWLRRRVMKRLFGFFSRRFPFAFCSQSYRRTERKNVSWILQNYFVGTI